MEHNKQHYRFVPEFLDYFLDQDMPDKLLYVILIFYRHQILKIHEREYGLREIFANLFLLV